MNKLFIPILVSLFLITPGLTQAKNKAAQNNTSSVRQQKILKEAKLSSKKFSLVYEKTWFLSLNKKQQDVYLKTVNDLVLKMSRQKRYSSNDKINDWLNLFLTPVYAEGEKINNGFIYTGNWESFISGVNLGALTPTCPAGQSACAPYTGLVKDAAGSVRLGCSANSTPSCVSNGDKALLRDTLNSCRTGISDICNSLNHLMTESTKGVREYCQSRSSAPWCTAATTAMNDAGIPLPPGEADAPTGANCDKAANDLVRRKEASRAPAGDSPQYSNNVFWRDMTAFAKNACARPSLTSMTEIVGVCDVSDMSGPAGNMNVTQVTAIPRLIKDARGNEVANPDFKTCQDQRVAKYREEHSTRLSTLNARKTQLSTQLSSVTGVGGAEATLKEELRLVGVQIAEAEATFNRGLPLIQRSNECVNMGVASIAAPAHDFSIHSLGDDIMNKFKNGTQLSELEENKFKAATGLSARQFKESFCGSATHAAFKKSLTSAVNFPQPVRGDMRVGSIQGYADQAKAALFRMNKCLSSVKTAKETGCAFYDVDDFNVIRTATNDAPILAKNRSTGECLLVTAHEFADVGDRFDSSTGNRLPERVSRITLDNLETGKTVTETPNSFARGHFLKVYRCKNDTIQAETYRETNPEKIDSEI